MAEFRKVHQYNVFSVNTPIQYAYAEFIQNKDLYLQLNDFYKTKRDFFNGLFKGSKHLTVNHGVASIPVSVFYHKTFDQKLLRFCFAKENDELEKAAERLIKI
jgi:methionine aminotransferase